MIMTVLTFIIAISYDVNNTKRHVYSMVKENEMLLSMCTCTMAQALFLLKSTWFSFLLFFFFLFFFFLVLFVCFVGALESG